jgi:hypothetical protein
MCCCSQAAVRILASSAEPSSRDGSDVVTLVGAWWEYSTRGTLKNGSIQLPGGGPEGS